MEPVVVDKALNFNDGKHVKAIPTLSKYACNAVPFKYSEISLIINECGARLAGNGDLHVFALSRANRVMTLSRPKPRASDRKRVDNQWKRRPQFIVDNSRRILLQLRLPEQVCAAPTFWYLI